MKRHLAPLLGLAIFSLAGLQPRVAHADEPVPQFRYSDDRLPPPAARTRLLATGTLFLTGAYLPVLGASYAWPDDPGAEHLRIPVAGPWMKIGRTTLCDNDPGAPAGCSDFTRIFGAVVLAFDGIAQAGGVALLLQGALLRTDRSQLRSPEVEGASSSLRQSLSARRKASSKRPLKLRLAPAAVGDVGLALAGRF